MPSTNSIQKPRYSYHIDFFDSIESGQVFNTKKLELSISPEGMWSSWDDMREYWGEFNSTTIRCFRNNRPGKLSRKSFGPNIFSEITPNKTGSIVHSVIGRSRLMTALYFLVNQIALYAIIRSTSPETKNAIIFSILYELILILSFIIFSVYDKKVLLPKQIRFYRERILVPQFQDAKNSNVNGSTINKPAAP